LSTAQEQEAGGSQRLPVGDVFPADDPVGRWIFFATHWISDLWTIEATSEQHARAGSLDFPFFFRLALSRFYEGERIVLAVDRMPEVAAFISQLSPEAVAAFDQLHAAYEGKDQSWAYQVLKLPRNLVSHYVRPEGAEARQLLASIAERPTAVVADERTGRVRLFSADEALLMASFATGAEQATLDAAEVVKSIAEIRRAALLVAGEAQMTYFAEKGISARDVRLLIRDGS
jgi:hypothetical protein